MQNERTLKFWDDFYEENAETEWIVQPSEFLLKEISNLLPTTASCSVLEIGCGTSSLARDLWLFCQQTRADKTTSSPNLQVCATDVSEVCIQQNQQRDERHLASKSILDDTQNHEDIFSYDILNVTQQNDHLQGKFDMILDKGCLDTFLFRSRQRGVGQQDYGALVRTVLGNLHTWLDEKGIYVIISPRSKLKSVRDYLGFASVERMKLASARAELVDNNKQDQGSGKNRSQMYMYVCRKDSTFSPHSEKTFRMDEVILPRADTKCTHCGISFQEFRSGRDMNPQGDKIWFREWNGHCLHCK